MQGDSKGSLVIDYNLVMNILAICTLGNKGNIHTDRVQIVKDNTIKIVVTELIKEKGNNWGMYIKRRRELYDMI